jgi:glycosyltransferase involved in cell wall biosynthesis
MSAYLPRQDALNKTVKSAISQTFGDFEYVIIQDDDNPETSRLLEEWRKEDKRISIIRNGDNLGLIASLNRGLKASRSPLIARIDVGDLWDRTKLAKQIHRFQENERLVVLGTQVQYVTPDGTPVNSMVMPVSDRKIREWLLGGRNPFIHPSVMFRKKESLFYNPLALHTEDFELWCRYSFWGELDNIDEQLIYYVIDTKGITGKKRYLMYANATKVYRRYSANIISTNESELRRGFRIKPSFRMSFFQGCGSILFSSGRCDIYRGNSVPGYLKLAASLMVSPGFVIKWMEGLLIKLRIKIGNRTN